MPDDPRGHGSPGVTGASMLVCRIIRDQFENSEPGDPAWLDLVLAVHPLPDPIGQTDVASMVHGFVLQEASFTVTPAEARRIRRAFGDAPPTPTSATGRTPPRSSGGHHRSVTATAAALADACAAATDNP